MQASQKGRCRWMPSSLPQRPCEHAIDGILDLKKLLRCVKQHCRRLGGGDQRYCRVRSFQGIPGRIRPYPSHRRALASQPIASYRRHFGTLGKQFGNAVLWLLSSRVLEKSRCHLRGLCSLEGHRLQCCGNLTPSSITYTLQRMIRSHIVSLPRRLTNVRRSQNHTGLDRRRYSSGDAQHVQTPVQSQRTDAVAPAALRPEGDAERVQTPVQTQRSADVSLHSSRPSRPPPSNTGIYRAMLLGLIAVPTLSYGYYVYRKEHMEKKWARMLEEAKQRKAR